MNPKNDVFPSGVEEERKLEDFSRHILQVHAIINLCKTSPMEARLTDSKFIEKWSLRVLVSKHK